MANPGLLVVIDGTCPELISFGVAGLFRKKTLIKVATPFSLEWPACGCPPFEKADVLAAASAMGARRAQAARVAKDGVLALVPNGELSLFAKFCKDRDIDRARWILSLRREWPEIDAFFAVRPPESGAAEPGDIEFWMEALHPTSFGGARTHVVTGPTSDDVVCQVAKKILSMHKERSRAS
jgi:hypothetical protein